MINSKDITNETFGRLTAVRKIGMSKNHHSLWLCECGCGEHNNVIVDIYDLIKGHTKSCGCLKKEASRNNGKKARDKIREKSTKHNGTHTRLYNIWTGMRQRCDNPNATDFSDYGGRGIKCCLEWYDFVNFRDWALSHGYNDNLSLDRIDCNGNYCPCNCKWSTTIEQARNKRNTLYITVANETHTICEWAEITGIEYRTLKYRFQHGWSEDEMFMPVSLNNKNIRKQKESIL